MKKYILTIIAALFSAVGFAQEPLEEWFGYDVEGTCIGQRYTYAQFVAKFGKPDRYRATGGDSHYIGKDCFHFENGGQFLEISIL